MSNNKVFISGPMRGIAEFNKPAFDEAERKLKAMGFSVFNPAWLTYDESWDRKDILAIDICALSKCRYILQLPGWWKASGANLEWSYAVNAGIYTLEFEGDDLYVNYPYNYYSHTGTLREKVTSAINANATIIQHEHWHKRKEQLMELLMQGYSVEELPEQLTKQYNVGPLSISTVQDMIRKLKIDVEAIKEFNSYGE